VETSAQLKHKRHQKNIWFTHLGLKHEMSVLLKLDLLLRQISLLLGIQQSTVVYQATIDLVSTVA
jgi:hypothetical protein